MSHSAQLENERIATRTPENSAGVRVVQQASPAGPVQPLAERAPPSGPDPKWRIHLLGIPGL